MELEDEEDLNNESAVLTTKESLLFSASMLAVAIWLKTNTLNLNSMVEPQIHLSLKIHFKKNNLCQLLMLKTFVVNRINIRTNTEQPITYIDIQYTIYCSD